MQREQEDMQREQNQQLQAIAQQQEIQRQAMAQQQDALQHEKQQEEARNHQDEMRRQQERHYEQLQEEMFIKNNVTSKPVRVQLLQFEKPEDADDDYSVSFFVDLVDSDKDKAGGATLGDITRVEVCIEHAEAEEEEEIMTFTDQFRQAMMVNGGEDAEEATCIDMTMHYICITWKILGAMVPPTHIWGGWATFWVSMSLVGVVTGIIGDIATVFGCVVGLDDEITGIFLVALGTSLPGEFDDSVRDVFSVHVLTF